MANLKEIAELAWRQMFPEGGPQAKTKKEEFIATARAEYAYQLWQKLKADKRENGETVVPNYLLTTAELEIVDDVMDVSKLKIMRGLDSDMWLQNVGGINCKCLYVKTTVNQAQLMCGDDSLPTDMRTFYVTGKQINFPKGVHTSPLKIIYANEGETIEDDDVEVDDVIAGLIRRSLIDIYKIEKEADKTNDQNPNR